MSKVAVYLGIMGTVILGFWLTGLVEDGGATSLLKILSNPDDFFNSEFMVAILLVMGLFATAVISVGFLINQKFDQALLTGFSTLLLFMGWNLYLIYQIVADNVNPELSLLIFSPMILIYLLSVVEWWRGTIG